MLATSVTEVTKIVKAIKDDAEDCFSADAKYVEKIFAAPRKRKENNDKTGKPKAKSTGKLHCVVIIF